MRRSCALFLLAALALTPIFATAAPPSGPTDVVMDAKTAPVPVVSHLITAPNEVLIPDTALVCDESSCVYAPGEVIPYAANMAPVPVTTQMAASSGISSANISVGMRQRASAITPTGRLSVSGMNTERTTIETPNVIGASVGSLPARLLQLRE